MRGERTPRWLRRVFACAVAVHSASAQAETSTVVVGAAYDRGCVYRSLFGEGYRDLWATPIEVETLRLDEARLRPVKQVGSMQTLGLALVDPAGRALTFRSIDKDASRLLPWFMRLPPWPGIFRDQTSAGFPAAPLVVSRFSEALGILEATPRLVKIADDEALGEFAETFGGEVGTLQEYPVSDASTARPGTFGATEVLSTGELFERFSQTGVDRPDARAYLRVRLLDQWIGDWDRHPEQMRWARMPSSERWQPVPEDRDGAFARYEGPIVAVSGVERLVEFDDTYPEDEGLFVQARNLDAWVLAGLDRAAWEAEIAFVRSRLDEGVIDEAIERLPEGWRARARELLREPLLARLEGLSKQAHRLRRRLARAPRWIGSRQEEVWRAECADDGRLTLSVSSVGEGSAAMQRVFRPDETERVEVWTRGGGDGEVIVDRHRCAVDLEFRRAAQGAQLPAWDLGIPNWD